MPELALRAGRLPSAVDWPAWRAAGIARLHAPPGAWSDELTRAVTDGGIVPVLELELDPATPPDAAGARVADGSSVCLRLAAAATPSAGAWQGAARACGLDAIVAELDCDAVLAEAARAGADVDAVTSTLRRYRSARLRGYAPAELPASTDALALLLGADATALLLSARAAVVAEAVSRAAALARGGGGRSVFLEVGLTPVDEDGLLGAVAALADEVFVPLALPLPQLLAAAVEAAAAGVRGAVVELPADALQRPEQLADVLDLLDGAGLRTLLLATNPDWLRLGSASVARAAARLHGRATALDRERQRRTELREA